MISRREFLLASSLILGNFPWQLVHAKNGGVEVNDVHSQLNLTRVESINTPASVEELQLVVRDAVRKNNPLSVCGARHAAGGQQFLQDQVLVDISKLDKIIDFDHDAGLVTVQSGLRWNVLNDYLANHSVSTGKIWGINQKQTGLNTLSIGGTAGANAHGQGLNLKPFVGDIESFRLITSTGDKVHCSRAENKDLFALCIGGYGLFGIISDMTLRLVPRQKVRRTVKLISVSQLEESYTSAITKGCRYGHWQINIDNTSENFLRDGHFSSYEAVSNDTPITRESSVTAEQWIELVSLAHRDRSLAYKTYVELLLTSSGAIDWADEWQNNLYVPDYHARMQSPKHLDVASSEVLTEFFVPMNKVEWFLEQARKYFTENKLDIIFSVIRFIDKDDESFLPWAKQKFVCIIFNFHTVHTKPEIARTMNAFSYLIDTAIAASGTFYLTYQHVANKQQLLACYPEFTEFLAAKQKFDPREIFQSDWYRWQRDLVAH